MKFSLIKSLALQASLVTAEIASYSPSDDSSISYAISIPSASAQSGSGDIFIQIKGPVSGSNARSWISIGQGSSMVGSNIFIAYPNKAGDNVTLSPRLGTSFREPKYNSDAKVELLGGTGIENGIMTANIKCSNCNTWSGGAMSFQDTKTDWIWASGGNGPLNSDNVEQSLSRHNEAATFQFDLSKAVGASGANPFIDTTGATTTVTPTTTPGSSDSSDSSSSSSSSETDTKLANIVPAHAAVMSLAFLIFFPLGAIIMRIGVGGYTVFIHAALQIFSYMLAIAGTGLGIYMALTLDSLQSAHAIIGLITVVSLLIQAPLGLLHHGLHKKHGGRTAVSYVHIWLGRALITLGAINGGLGLQLADAASENRAGVIAYGVLAAVIYISYFAMIAATFGKGKKTATRHGPMRQYKTESTSQVS